MALLMGVPRTPSRCWPSAVSGACSAGMDFVETPDETVKEELKNTATDKPWARTNASVSL